MLKKTRSHHRDQCMGHLMSNAISEFPFDVSGQKHKSNPICNASCLFVGFSPKFSELDSVRSPTSPLDFRVFSYLGNSSTCPGSTHEGHPESWGCRKVGLSIVETLDDDGEQSGKVLCSSDSKNILFGPQMRIKTPNFQSLTKPFETANSLPKNYAVFPYTQIKPSNLQLGYSSVLFGLGETSLEVEPLGKVPFCSLDSGRSELHLVNLTNSNTNSSSGYFCLENGTNPVSSLPQFSGESQNLGSSLDTKLKSIPMPVGPDHCFTRSLSASDIDLSEDYTCVKIHRPIPKTNHIFGDCVLECDNNELTNFSDKEEKEFGLPVAVAGKCSEIPIPFPLDDFLSVCHSCKKKLEGEDIYMYRGEKAFCSCSCRSEGILIEEATKKTINDSSRYSSQLNNESEQIFEFAT